MVWNHRVFREEESFGGVTEPVYTIREVFYDNDKRPRSYGDTPSYPVGNTLEELSSDLAWIIKALTLPVIGSDLKEIEPALYIADELEAAVKTHPEHFPEFLRKHEGKG